MQWLPIGFSKRSQGINLIQWARLLFSDIRERGWHQLHPWTSMRYSFSSMVLLLLISWALSSEMCSLWWDRTSSISRCFQEAYDCPFPGQSCFLVFIPKAAIRYTFLNLDLIFPTQILFYIIQAKPCTAKPGPASIRPTTRSDTPCQICTKLANIRTVVPYSGRHNTNKYIKCLGFLHSLQKGRNPAWT